MDIESLIEYVIEHPRFKNELYKYALSKPNEIKILFKDVLHEVENKTINHTFKYLSQYKLKDGNRHKDLLDRITPLNTLSINFNIPMDRVKLSDRDTDELTKIYENDLSRIPTTNTKKILISNINQLVFIRYCSGGDDTAIVTKVSLDSKYHLLLFSNNRILRFKFNTTYASSHSCYKSSQNGAWIKGSIIDKTHKSQVFISFKKDEKV